MPSDDVEIFTSLRHDAQCAEEDPENGPFYMLHYHRDRLLEAAEFFGFKSAVDRFDGKEGLGWLKESLEQNVRDWKPESKDGSTEDPLKVRRISVYTRKIASIYFLIVDQ